MAKRICIDAGHGGSDPGAKNGTYKEKNAALGIAFELGLVLYRGGYEVYFTRTNDTAVSLADRCTISNLADVDLFVSVHLNSATSTIPAGIETWVYRSASGTARKVADKVQKQLIEATGAKDRGDAAGSIEARTGNLGPRSFLDHKAIREGVERARRTSFPGHLQFVIIFLEFFVFFVLTLL